MQTLLPVVVGFVVLGAISARAAPIDARALAEHLADHVERTVEIDDQVGRVSRRFTHGEEALGFRSDTHIKLLLVESRLAAFVPRNERTARMFQKVEEGMPVHLTGVVRKTEVARPSTEIIGTNVDITIRYPDEAVALLAVTAVDTGPFRAALDEKSYRVVQPTTFSGPGVSLDVRVGARLARGMSFSRAFSADDAAYGANEANTLKVVDLIPGAVLYLQRTPKNLALLLTIERGDLVEVDGHLWPAQGRAERVLVADALRITHAAH